MCNSCPPPRILRKKSGKKKRIFLYGLGYVWLMYRLLLLFVLTQRSRFSGPFKYLEHVRKVHRKFSWSLSKKVWSQKMRFCQNIPTWFWPSFFQNLNFFHFSWHIIRLVCRAVTIFLLTQKARSGGHLRYLEHVRKVQRKFSRRIWKKNFRPKNGVLSEYSNPILSFVFTHFLNWNFFFKCV